jgi:hypothetical protein
MSFLSLTLFHQIVFGISGKGFLHTKFSMSPRVSISLNSQYKSYSLLESKTNISGLSSVNFLSPLRPLRILLPFSSYFWVLCLNRAIKVVSKKLGWKKVFDKKQTVTKIKIYERENETNRNRIRPT